MYNTANDSPNLANRLWMSFNDIKKRKQNIFLKNNTLARAQTLSKNPMEPAQG